MMRGSRSFWLGLLIALLFAPSAWAGDVQLARHLTDRGIQLQQAGEHEAALRLFEAALSETDHPKIRYFRAKSLRALARRDEAISEFEAILERPEVAKYRTEIAAFIAGMKGELERDALGRRLEEEQAARAKAEAERKALERKGDVAAIDFLRRKRSGLMPTSEARGVDGPVVARLVPMVPTMWEPGAHDDGRLRLAEVAASFGRYETELTAAKILTVVSALGMSMGIGLGLNPLADRPAGPGAQQAGLAIGVVEVIAGLAAAVVWPSTPPDPRLTRDRP